MDHRLCKSVACAENEPPTGMHPCIDHSFPASRMRLLFSILNWIVFVICVCVMNQNFVEFALPALSSFFKSRLTDHKISFIRHRNLLFLNTRRASYLFMLGPNSVTRQTASSGEQTCFLNVCKMPFWC